MQFSYHFSTRTLKFASNRFIITAFFNSLAAFFWSLCDEGRGYASKGEKKYCGKTISKTTEIRVRNQQTNREKEKIEINALRFTQVKKCTTHSQRADGKCH